LQFSGLKQNQFRAIFGSYSTLSACSRIGFWLATSQFYFIQRYPASSETPDHPHKPANFALHEMKFARFRLKTNSRTGSKFASFQFESNNFANSIYTMYLPNILDNFDFDELPEWSGEGEIVAKFYSTMEAEVAAARLRSEGIHCFLANSISQSVLPHVQGIVRLHTRPIDAAEAREILQEAAIETDGPSARKNSGAGAIILIAVIIGLLLAWLLVKSMG
jgi:hypothetical protein